MSSMSSKEFLTEIITSFRKEFKKLSPESQKQITEKAFGISLLEPCQIEVLELGEGKAVVCLVVHDQNLPDMVLKIRKDVSSLDESEFITKYEDEFSFVLELFSKKEFDKIESPLEALVICTESKVNFFEYSSS